MSFFGSLIRRAAPAFANLRDRANAIAAAPLQRLHDTLTARKADRLHREEKKVRQERAKQERDRAQEKKRLKKAAKQQLKERQLAKQQEVRDRRAHRVRANDEHILADVRAQYRREEQLARQTAVRDLRIQRANENRKVVRLGLERLFTHRRGAAQSSAPAFVNGPHMSADYHHRRFNVPGQQVDARELIENLAPFIKLESRVAHNKYDRYFFQCVMSAEFEMPSGEVKSEKRWLDQKEIVNTRELSDSVIETMQRHYDKWVDSTTHEQTGGVIKRIEFLELQFWRAPILAGSCYMATPPELKNTSILNIQNKDRKCPLYDIKAALKPVSYKQHPYRASNYDITDFNLEGIEFPIRPCDFGRLERQNREMRFAVNVFRIVNKKVVAERLARDDYGELTGVEEINLLLLAMPNGVDGHYILLKNFNAFMNKYNGSSRHYYCPRCCTGRVRSECLQRHMAICKGAREVGATLPVEGSVIEFKQHDRQVKHPCVIMADSEAVQRGPMTRARHYASGYSLYNTMTQEVWKSTQPITDKTKTEEYGEEQSKAFVQKILDIARDYESRDLKYIPDAEDAAAFEKADACYLCCQRFTEKDPKVLDHCHVTGRYRGAAHNSCNLNLRKPNFIPINMHYANYDLQLIIRQLSELNSRALFGDCQTKLMKQKARLEKWLASLRVKKAACELRDLANAERGVVNERLKARIRSLAEKEVRHLEKLRNVTAAVQAEGANLEENISRAELRIAELEAKLEPLVLSEEIARVKKRALLTKQLQAAVAELKKLRGERTAFLCDERAALSGICKSSEKFLSLSVKLLARVDPDGKRHWLELRFRDTFADSLASLEKLVESLEGNLPILEAHLADQPKLLELLKQKGSFPFEWYDDIRKGLETSLPAIENWYSRTKLKKLSEAEYRRAQAVWAQLGESPTVRKYHDVYVVADTLQLADWVEAYRNLFLELFRLDPMYYYGASNVSWSAMVRNTRKFFVHVSSAKSVDEELEKGWIFNTDFVGEPLRIPLLHKGQEDMLEMIERSVRGGISQTGSLRYAKADEHHAILNIDANNQYGWAMIQPMGYGGFQWCDAAEVERQLLAGTFRYDPEGSEGMKIEADLECPVSMQDAHVDLPPVPETTQISDEHLSESQRGRPHGKKLCTTFLPKEKYVCEMENLLDYKSRGIKVIKVHRVLKYHQERWLAPYILHNNARRAAAKSDFERNLFKLLNNAVFGKTMENVRKRSDIRICHPGRVPRKHEDLLRCWDPIDRSLMVLRFNKEEVLIDKPIYVGSKILDISKLLMYRMYYDELKRWFGDRVALIYMDTDSFLLYIKTDNLDQELIESGIAGKIMDPSEYPKDHVQYQMHPDPNKNKGVLGMFKNEAVKKGVFSTILEAWAIGSKMYAYVVSDGRSVRKVKGIPSAVVREYLKPEIFDEVLFSKQDAAPVPITQIRSLKHTNFTLTSSKKSVRYVDDKRYCEDGIHTTPLGYYKNRTSAG